VEGGKLGLAWGAAIGTCFGPEGTAPGAAIGGVVVGMFGGAVGGIVGYLGGATMTDWMLETFSPDFYYGMKIDAIDNAEARLKSNIERLSGLSNPLTNATSAN
jgi:hypothetical protein